MSNLLNALVSLSFCFVFFIIVMSEFDEFESEKTHLQPQSFPLEK